MEVRSDRTPQPARSTDGIVFDRRALEIHASGRLSQIFGPAFADQDGLHPARPHARTAAAARRSRRAPGGRTPLAGHRHRLDGDRRRGGRLVPARQPHARGDHDRGRAGRPAARLLARRRRPQPRGARLPAARLRADLPRRAPRRRRNPALRDRRRRPRAAGGGPSLLLPLHLHRRRVSPASPCGAGRPASSPTRNSPGRRACSGTRRPLEPRDGARVDPPPVSAGPVAALPRAARGLRGRARRRVFRSRLRGGCDSHPHAESARRPAAAARRGDGDRRRGRALGTRLSARRGSHRPGRLVLRGTLHERPLHARDPDVRGRPAGDGGLPGRVGLHAGAGRLALRAGAG